MLRTIKRNKEKAKEMILVLGQWIKTNREVLNLSQEQLGELVGCSQQGIMNYEKNLRQPSMEMITELARVFDSEIRVSGKGISSTSSAKMLASRLEKIRGYFSEISKYDTKNQPSCCSVEELEKNEKLIVKRLEQLIALNPSSEFYFNLKGQKCSLEVLREILKDDELCEAIGFDLEQQALKQMIQFDHPTDLFDPVADSVLSGYEMEIYSKDEDCQSSLNLSLYSPEKEVDESRQWYWCFYSEIDGVLDHLQSMIPLEACKGQELIQQLIEMAETMMNLPEFLAMLG